MLKRNALPIVGIIGLLVVWWLITASGLVRPIFLPGPAIVLERTFSLLFAGELTADILATTWRLLLGLLLGVAIGVPLGLIMGSSERIYSMLEVVIDFFRSIPVACLFPVFLLAFGVGNGSKVATAAYSTALIMAVNTIYGVQGGNAMRRRVARLLGASRLQVYVYTVLPGAAVQIAAGLRTSLSLGLIVVLMTEMFLGGKVGLGQKIYEWGLLYRIPEMYAAILITGLLGYLFNRVLVVCENHLIHWKGVL